ncbi:LamG-like jellyroll fold domain-containing protein [Pseudomonas sp.]|uniref:LamG-like jellyroll fold domain-containing protein n=1 Tax=Pseudomonas sp. TaxID=306 RepID=UPI003341E014
MAIQQLLASYGAAGGGGSSLSSTILGLTPWGYWRLDETGTLTTAADSSGNARSGTYIGTGTTDVAGLFGGSVRAKTLNGSDAVTCPTYTATAGSPFSALSVVRFDSTSSMAFLSGDGVGGGNRMFQLRASGGRTQAALVNPASVVVESPLTYNDNNPHMAVLVYDQSLAAADGRLKLYMNGSEVARSTAAITNSETAAPLSIGQRGNTSATSRLNGSIDECAFFNYALSAAQVSALWAARDTP